MAKIQQRDRLELRTSLRNRHTDSILLELKSGVPIDAKYLALSSRVKQKMTNVLHLKSENPYDEFLERHHNSQP